MKLIQGIEIEESRDLGYNLKLLREKLAYKLSFWNHYSKGLKGIAGSMHTKRVHGVIRCIYFILLLPKYVSYKLSKKHIAEKINQAEDELIAHYKLPETKVKQFRLECDEEKAFYQNEIQIIDSELSLLKEKLSASSLGDHTRNEITDLINGYEVNLLKKTSKFHFYKSCEDRLIKIEEQILLQRTLQGSKRKLLSLQDDESDSTRLTEIKKEFELYDYYGDLLEDISTNLKKVSLDKEETLRQSELNDMLSKIKIVEKN